MSQVYSNPKRATDPTTLPNVETFYYDGKNANPKYFAGGIWTDEYDQPMEKGWYFWYCMPGCLPDSEPEGPFKTEQEAIDYCQEADAE